MVNIYPNTSNEEVNIEFKKMMGDENIRVVDLAGRIVFQKQLNYENKVVLSTLNWSNGVYIIEVQSGSNTSMNKLIVQHP